MHNIESSGSALLHLLFCGAIVVSFVSCLITSSSDTNPNNNNEMKIDYNAYMAGMAENETYHSDKRLIIEEFYRQSALAAKNSNQDFHINQSVIKSSTNSSSSSSFDENSDANGKSFTQAAASPSTSNTNSQGKPSLTHSLTHSTDFSHIYL